MKACFICSLTCSGLRLVKVWDKAIQSYMEHEVCASCRERYGL